MQQIKQKFISRRLRSLRIVGGTNKKMAQAGLVNDYKSMTDESVIEQIKLGDINALNYIMDKYSELVNMKASKFFIVGAERGDIVQEGLIGLYKATKAFNTEKQNYLNLI